MTEKFAPDLYKKIVDEHQKIKNKELKRLLSQKALESMTGDSVIDKISRILFPVLFMLFNLFYYIYYVEARHHALRTKSSLCNDISDYK